jgi:hypothetical protein
VGCSTDADDTENTAGSPSAAERARARAAADSEALLQRYDAALAAHPPLAERLNPLRAEVVRHVTAFGGNGSAPSATTSATATVSPSAVATAVPATASDALAGLAAAERTLADKRAKALLDLPGEPARLLASVAAAGAAHAYLLTEGAK